MFKNPEFQQHSTVDKRGRQVEKRKNQDNMRKYYKLKDEVCLRPLPAIMFMRHFNSHCLCIHASLLRARSPPSVKSKNCNFFVMPDALRFALLIFGCAN